MPAPEENTCSHWGQQALTIPSAHQQTRSVLLLSPLPFSCTRSEVTHTQTSALVLSTPLRDSAGTKALLSSTAAKGRELLCQRAGTPREGVPTGGTYASGKRQAQAGIKGNGTMPWSTVSRAGPGPRGCAAWETAVAIVRDGAAGLAGNGGEEPLSYCVSPRHQRLSQSPHACLESCSRTGEPGSAAGP